MKSGDSLSTRYLNENLFRFIPSIFHVRELKDPVFDAVEGMEDFKVEETILEFKALTFLADLSEHKSLNLLVAGYRGQLHQQIQKSPPYH